MVAEMILHKEGKIRQKTHIHLDHKGLVLLQPAQHDFFSFIPAGGGFSGGSDPAPLRGQNFQTRSFFTAPGIAAAAQKRQPAFGMPVYETDALAQSEQHFFADWAIMEVEKMQHGAGDAMLRMQECEFRNDFH